MVAERDTTIPDALERVHAAAAALGGSLDLEFLESGLYPITRSTFTRGGTIVSEGMGKGKARQAEASALFEALEHFYLRSSNQEPAFELKSAVEIASQPALEFDQLVHLLATSHPTAQIACARYGHVEIPTIGTWVPLFFVDPTYQLTPLDGDKLEYREYCPLGTSTGCAAGSTELEAVLHGLLESLERDALARFFLGRRNLGLGHQVCLVDEESLPSPVKDLVHEVAERMLGKVAVVDLTTEVGIPVYMAECRKPEMPLGIFGCGCSLDAPYAFERAVTELFQVSLQTRWDVVDANFIRAARQAPELWNLVVPLEKGNAITVPLRSEHVQGVETPRDSLATVLSATARSGLVPLYRMTSSPRLPITTVNVYVAGAERFYLARWGHRISPTGRERLLT